MGKTVDSAQRDRASRLLPRRVAMQGGTTTLGDCVSGLRHLIDPRHLVRGPAISKYEQAFAEKIGVRHACSFSAGRVGLYGLLRALDIGSGDEVLLQVPTHVVVPNAVRYTGAQPVYVDCRLDSYNVDLEEAERRITPRTRAIILQHTFGIPADLDSALDVTRRHGLELIEDCVHALGATYDGRPVGGFGRAAFFSTEETKTISSTMGGMVVTDDPELAAHMQAFQARCPWPSGSKTASYVLKLVIYHLLTEPSLHSYIRPLYEFVGRRHPLPRATSSEEMSGKRPHDYEKRLSNAQAVLALRQLRRLDENLAHRHAIARVYASLLSQQGIASPVAPPKGQPAFVRYPIWAEDRKAMLAAAAPHAQLGDWFTSVLEESLSPVYAGYQSGSCPRAEAAAQHLVNLPTHLRVTEQDAEVIAWSIADSIPSARSGK
jgi:perosamine synthetase